MLSKEERQVAKERKLADRKAKEALYWDPMADKDPNYFENLRPKSYEANFEKAIQNLNDIMSNSAKFNEMNDNIFKAIDEDNVGELQIDIAEEFFRDVIRGNQIEGCTNTNFEQECEEVFTILSSNDNGVIMQEEMAEFMRELILRQINNLQTRVEKIKYQRAIDKMKLEKKGKD